MVRSWQASTGKLNESTFDVLIQDVITLTTLSANNCAGSDNNRPSVNLGIFCGLFLLTLSEMGERGVEEVTMTAEGRREPRERRFPSPPRTSSRTRALPDCSHHHYPPPRRQRCVTTTGLWRRARPLGESCTDSDFALSRRYVSVRSNNIASLFVSIILCE